VSSRREFCAGCCLLACGAVLGAQAAPDGEPPLKPTKETRAGMKPGSVRDYRKLGRFFLMADAAGIYALTSVCTHRGCNVNAAGGEGFRCPCHDSAYDPQGRVTEGPARLPLRHLLVREAGGILEVDVSVTVDPAVRI